MSSKKYSLVLKEASLFEKELDELTIRLRNCSQGIVVKKENDELSVLVRGRDEAGCRISPASKQETEDGETQLSFQIEMIGGRESVMALQMLRGIYQHRPVYCEIIDQSTETIIPLSSHIYPINWHGMNPELVIILARLGFGDGYYDIKDKAIYVCADDGSVHIINERLVEYLMTTHFRETDQLRDLTYRVADNPSQFALKCDKQLVPRHFYSYLGKQTKILNDSGWDIESIRQKVFVRPMIYELRGDMRFYYCQTTYSGETLLMDKIRKGETLNDTLIRVLSEELKIAQDYVVAVVNYQTEFDRDRNGVITPRLKAYVFVDSIADEEWHKGRKFKASTGNLPSYDEEGYSWTSKARGSKKILI